MSGWAAASSGPTLAGLGDRVRDFVAASKAPETLRAYGMEVMPAVLLDALILSYPSERYRSAWIGVAVHSLQSVPIGAVVLGLSFEAAWAHLVGTDRPAMATVRGSL